MCNVLTHTSQSHLTHILNTYSKYMSTHIRHATIISHQQQHKYHTTIPYSLHNQATTTSVWIVNRTSFVGFWYVHVARNGKDATSKSPVSRQGWKRVGHSALIHHKASAFWGDFVSAADSQFFLLLENPSTKAIFSVLSHLPVLFVVADCQLTKIMVFQGQDAWRRHPFFQGLWKSPFPGFQKAAVIYVAYMSLEYAYKVCIPSILLPTSSTSADKFSNPFFFVCLPSTSLPTLRANANYFKYS